MNVTDIRRAPGAVKRRKRLARGIGSGRGKTAGRGTKGFMARSGSRRRPGFEGGSMPLIRRLPKRGFRNRFRVSYTVVNVGAIDQRQMDSPITVQALRQAGLVDRSALVKILGDGTCTKPIHVQAHRFSKSAVEKLTQAGGRAEVVSQ